jgi:hypothetical protein
VAKFSHPAVAYRVSGLHFARGALHEPPFPWAEQDL